MANIGKVLKDEISRISRYEAKVATDPLRKPAGVVRHDLADLKKRVADLEKSNKQLQSAVAELLGVQPAPPPTEPSARQWISGKGIKSLRKRLGLSQPEFAKLVGVSASAVHLWESNPGMLKLRDSTKASVFAVRGIGAKDAQATLAEMQTAPTKSKGKRKPAAGA